MLWERLWCLLVEMVVRKPGEYHYERVESGLFLLLLQERLNVVFLFLLPLLVSGKMSKTGWGWQHFTVLFMCLLRKLQLVYTRPLLLIDQQTISTSSSTSFHSNFSKSHLLLVKSKYIYYLLCNFCVSGTLLWIALTPQYMKDFIYTSLFKFQGIACVDVQREFLYAHRSHIKCSHIILLSLYHLNLLNVYYLYSC